jgi:hypothetical protein
MIGDLIIEIFRIKNIELFWEGKETNQNYPCHLMNEDNHTDIRSMQKVVMNQCRITILVLAESSFELNNMSLNVKDILDDYKGVVLGRRIRSIRYTGMNPEVVGEDVMGLDFDVKVEPK